MLKNLVLLLSFTFVICEPACYWNRKCPYDLFGSKTSYEVVRGDLRDQPSNGCEVISIWSIHRHGNRNPGSSATAEIKTIQEKILQELEIKRLSGDINPNICAQDLQDLLNWRWNSTMEDATSELTGTGYEELFDIGKRIAQRYVDSISRNRERVYFRATNSQRTITSGMAFVHGLTTGLADTNFSAVIDDPREEDDVIRGYENCRTYQENVKEGQLLADELAAYDSSPEFLGVMDRVQAKLDIQYTLSAEEVFTLYELCRFEVSWSVNLRSPWCSFFTDQDLIVLEYRDDVRHYYRNGYGSMVNVKLGGLPLKDLYENFEKAIQGDGKVLVSYFTHNAMMEMLFSALGLYRDREPIRGSVRNVNRLWRSSEIGAFATNLIAVLYRCEESGQQVHRVQLLINEKPTSICSSEGCTWQHFRERFQVFTNASLDFCESEDPDIVLPAPSSGYKAFLTPLVLCLLIAKIFMVR